MGKPQNIFWKSTLRQPVQTLLLLLLAAAAMFVFTARLLECALIFRETSRAENSCRAVGRLEQTGPLADLQGMTEYLETSPYVKLVEKQWSTSGVLPEGVYNADTEDCSLGNDRSLYPGGWPSDIIFYARIQSVEEKGDGRLIRLEVDQVVTGYPEYLTPGKQLELEASPDLTAAVETMTVGGRYLMRATYDPELDGGAMKRYLLVPLTEEGSPVLEAPRDLGLSDPEYGDLGLEVQMVNENQRSMFVIAVPDMSALPSVQESVHTYFLREGRFLTAEDTEENRQVCVIRDAFAQLRGYELGDTITLKLRNIASAGGYLIVEQDAYAYDSIPAHEVALEIVGIIGLDEAREDSGTLQDLVFIPSCAVPDDFQPVMTSGGTYLELTAQSFVLHSPDDAPAFLAEAEGPLLDMGFRVTIVENNWETLKPMADAMRGAARRGAILSGALPAAALVLLGFAYFRLRRRDAVLCRAMGVPALRCGAACALPFAVTAGAGVLLGGALGAWYAAARARSALEPVSALQPGVQTQVPAAWAVTAVFIALLLTAAVAAVVSALAVRDPAAALLRPGGRARKTAGT